MPPISTGWDLTLDRGMCPDREWTLVAPGPILSPPSQANMAILWLWKLKFLDEITSEVTQNHFGPRVVNIPLLLLLGINKDEQKCGTDWNGVGMVVPER